MVSGAVADLAVNAETASPSPPPAGASGNFRLLLEFVVADRPSSGCALCSCLLSRCLPRAAAVPVAGTPFLKSAGEPRGLPVFGDPSDFFLDKNGCGLVSFAARTSAGLMADCDLARRSAFFVNEVREAVLTSRGLTEDLFLALF